MMNATLRGKTDAGISHVRFNEGEVVSCPPTVGCPEGIAMRGAKPRRGSFKELVLAGAACLSAAAWGFDVKVQPGDTFEKVRDGIREARANGKIAKDEAVTVTLAPGEYLVAGNRIELDGADSGSAGAPVTWRAENRGTVRLFGGVRLSADDFRPLADEAMRTRLDPSVADKVMVADLSSRFAGDFKPWPDSIRGVLPGPWLCCNGEHLPIARWPNADAENHGWSGFDVCLAAGGDEWKQKAKNPPPDATAPGAFEFPGDRAAKWRFEDGVWMLSYWKHDWACEYLRAASFNPETKALTLATWAQYGVGKGNNGYFKKRRFYALNVFEELDAPGEWYLDRKAKKLYYIPKGRLEDEELVLADDTAPFVVLKGASHVVFENIDFRYSHGKSVFSVKGADNVIRNCGFNCHGGCAIVVDGDRNRITGCTIAHNGATAVSMNGGNRRMLLPANNLLDHCEIYDYAIFKRIYASCITLSGCGQAIRNCKIHDGPYIALDYNGNEHLIADNTFTRVVLEAGDSGCIYTGHDPSGHGTLIFGNTIADIAWTEEETNSRQGIYFDDCDWGDDVIGNTFRHAGRAFLIGGGNLHRIYNNTITECAHGVHCDSRGRTWRLKRNSFPTDAEGRTFADTKCRGFNYRYAPWNVMYPELAEAIENLPELPGRNTVQGNVFHKIRGRVFEYDWLVQTVLPMNTNENTVVAKGGALPAENPQKIALSDAVVNRLAAPDGETVAKVYLDASSHFVWTLRNGQETILNPSPLGITVDTLNTGKLVVPGAATTVAENAQPAPTFTNATALAYNEYRIPLRSLVDAKEVAFFDVRVWKNGAAYRWTVPGSGERLVVGENNAFATPYGRLRIVESERPKDYAELHHYERGLSLGITFPQYPRGWRQTGEVVSPWRSVTLR